MFTCCCPNKQDDLPHTNILREKLVSDKSKLLQYSSSQSLPSFNNLEVETSNKWINKKLQIMDKKTSSNFETPSNFQKKKTNGKDQQENIYRTKNKPRSMITRSIRVEQCQEESIKSELWLNESGTKILYIIDSEQVQMILTFKIIKSKIHAQSMVDHSFHSHKKQKQNFNTFGLDFIIFNKTASQIRASLDVFHHHRVYGAFKDDPQLRKSCYQRDNIRQIIVISSNCIRLQVFDTIVIYCLSQKDFYQVLKFCIQITQFYDLDDLFKAIFVFPAFFSLIDISLIITHMLRKFVISENLEKVIKYLGYHLELVENDKSQAAIFVSNNHYHCQGEEIVKKQFQTKVQLAIGVLMVQMTHSNFKVYEKLLDGFFQDMSIHKYVRFIKFINDGNKEALTELQQLKILDQSHILELQNSSRISFIVPKQNHKYLLISNRFKKKISDLFTAYQTPTINLSQQSQKKQWDDNLDSYVIRYGSMKNLQQQSNVEENNDIFQIIADREIDITRLENITQIQILEYD